MAESPELVRLVRIVAVSPSDVMAERELLATVVEELNRVVAPSRGCQLRLWRWETDAHPGLHLEGPQGLIDDAMQIDDADVVVGIFWTRFGTPTLDSGSGTEHELRRACEAWQARRRPQVMVYFRERRGRPKDADAAQLERLLRFREAMPTQLLWWTYAKPVDFERAVRGHLTDFIMRLEGTPPRAREPDSPRQDPLRSESHSATAADVAVKQYDRETDSVRAEVIAAAGTRLPFTTWSDCTTLIDNQAEVSMELLQRSGSPSASADVHLFAPLGHVTIGLRPGLPSDTPLRITTAIDATGRLTAQATYPGSDAAAVESDLGTSRSRGRPVRVRVRHNGP